MKNRAFTLVELLVVILIIGILAAIAVPQYQKAVMKANLHKGIPLVESLYQAQQAYYLTHGEFATDLDLLDISIPKDESCTNVKANGVFRYDCKFGIIGIHDSYSNIQYKGKKAQIAYLHFIEDLDLTSNNLPVFKKDTRYCWAKNNLEIAKNICISMGGKFIGKNNSWEYYELS